MIEVKLRDYQKKAADSIVSFFLSSNKERNGIVVVPTGGGKSWIIVDVANRLKDDVLVLCPSREILLQNYEKMYKINPSCCSMYSASVGHKDISPVTFATIGSIMSHIDDFDHFKAIIIDECHGVNATGGQYATFIQKVKRKVLGLTATPYRLSTAQGIMTQDKGFLPNGSYKDEDYFFDEFHPKPGVQFANACILKFLTRTRPRIFHDVLYEVSIQTLLQQGYLARLRYFDMSAIDTRRVKRNSTGRDYDEQSLSDEFARCGLANQLSGIVKRLLHPKDGRPRKGILVFTQFIDESEALAREIEGVAIVTGSTPKKEREKILENFKSGKIKVLSNVGVLTTGFDYPELDTVVMARPTMSLAMWYQICVDVETEILTKRGWLTCDDIQNDDIVAAYKDGEVLWSKIQNITRRKVYEGEVMVSTENSFINFRVTGEHDLLVRSRGASCNFFKQKAIDVATKRKGLMEIPVSGVEDVKGCNLSDDEIRFIGWVVSDGSVSKQNHAIHIVQSKVNENNIYEIEKVLKSCNLRFCKVLAKRKGKEAKYADTYHFNISYGQPKKKEDREKGLTGWQKYESYINGCKTWSAAFEEFNSHQFDIFIDTLDKADGSHTKSIVYTKHTKSICCGIFEDYCDRLQSLAVRRGWRACKSIYKKGRKNPVYMLRLLKVKKTTISGYNCDRNNNRTRLVISKPDSNQIVWCIKNEIGTIITRRNGKVVIMGNCGRAIRPFEGKDGWIVDLGENIKRFGKVEDLQLCVDQKPGQWYVRGIVGGYYKPLTNVYF